MDNHKVTYSALQKYYSALKSLNSFSGTNNFFDAIAYLDTFFSEFRNITFVIQKELDGDSRPVYEELRDKYLKNDYMKWFIDTRNNVTKQSPFNLKKTLTIDVYLPTETISFSDSSFTIDMYEPFEKIVSVIKHLVMHRYKMVEIFLSSKIVFNEDGNEVNIYPKIVEGITTMNEFLSVFLKTNKCECNICSELRKSTDDLYQWVSYNELKFVRDYVIEENTYEGISGVVKVSDSEGKLNDIFSSRVPLTFKFLKGPIDNINYLFKMFVHVHIHIYMLQDNKIIPTFIILYNDKTLRIVPIIADIKSTLYRKVNEISELKDFQDVKAIFFVGESYVYLLDRFKEINQLPYSQRIEKAQSELLTFAMLCEDGTEQSIYFEKEKINIKTYIDDVQKKSQIVESATISEADWLNPLRVKFRQFKKYSEK